MIVAISKFLKQKIRSNMFISNNNGTNMKTCGTPIKMSSKVQYNQKPWRGLSGKYYHGHRYQEISAIFESYVFEIFLH